MTSRRSTLHLAAPCRATLCTLAIGLCSPLAAQATSSEAKEYMYEVGIGGGASVAYGDVNRSRPLYSPALAGALVWRYNANPRWALCCDVSALGLKGNTHDFSYTYPDGAAYLVDSRLWQASCRPEFHFWNYGWASDYREKRRVAPFLTAGLGLGLALADRQPANATAATDGHRTSLAVSIPLGAGLKWKIAPRWNAQMTCLFSKMMSDSADGVEDPMGIAHDALKNTDWTGSLLLSVTFDFKERCMECKNQHSY